MEKLISKETESDLTKLGVYQIIGGAIGIIILLWVIFKTPLMSGLTVLLFLLILAGSEARAQALNCTYKAPVVNINFGTGNVEDLNPSGTAAYQRVS
ncbi:MAG: hypothetical protein EOO89_31340, partial [Pedobacter sp.]